jgi:hypothetical protein
MSLHNLGSRNTDLGNCRHYDYNGAQQLHVDIIVEGRVCGNTPGVAPLEVTKTACYERMETRMLISYGACYERTRRPERASRKRGGRLYHIRTNNTTPQPKLLNL